MNSAVQGALYLLIVGVCVGISIYTTHEGFAADFPSMSIVFAALIGIGLIAADFGVRTARLRGSGLLKPIAFLLVCMIASAASHFNYFYSRSVNETLVSDKAKSAVQIYQRNVENARSALTAKDSANALQDQLLDDLDKLREQIEDDGRPGFGVRADELVNKIITRLNEAGLDYGDLSRPVIGTPREDALAWVDGPFAERVKQRLTAHVAVDRVSVELQRLEQDRSDVGKRQTDFMALPAGERTASGMEFIDYVASMSVEMRTRVSQVLAETGVESGWQLPDEPIRASEARVGTIAYSLQAAFVDRQYPQVTAISIAISLLIDIIPLCFVLLLSSARPAEDNGSDGRSRQRKGIMARLFRRRSENGYENIRERS